MLKILPPSLQRFLAVLVIDVESDLLIPYRILEDHGVPKEHYGETYRWVVMELARCWHDHPIFINCAYPLPDISPHVLQKLHRWIIHQPKTALSRVQALLYSAPMGMVEEILLLDNCLCFCYERFE